MAGTARFGWLLAGLALLVSIGGLAATWHVNPGDDIQAVIDTAAAGDTIVVAAGTYNLTGTINVTKMLTILGAQANVDPRPSAGGRTGPETLLTSTTTVFDIQAHDVVINGFSIETNINNANTNIIHDSSTSFTSENATIAYNIITNTGSTMNEAVKIRCGEAPVIAYNYIYNIPSPGDAINFDRVTNGRIEYNEIFNSGSENAAIYIYDSQYTWIVGNIVDTTTKNDGIKLGRKSSGNATLSGGWIIGNLVMNTAQDGITVYASDVVVEGNTVMGATTENGAIYLAFGISNIVIRYNTIVDNALATGKWGTPGGITIGSAVNASTVEIYGNTITGNYPVDVANMASGAPLLDATGNWWGQDTGPLAGQIAGNVAYSPWLGNEPSEPTWTFIVAQAGPEPSPGYIQRAVDLARDGDVVFVQAGTYAENVQVYKALNLIGDNASISPAAGAAITLRSPGSDALEDMLISINTSGGAYGVLIDGGLWAHIPGEDVVIENLTLAGVSLSGHGQEGLVIMNGAQVTGLFVVDSAFLYNRVGLGISGTGTAVADASVTSSLFVENTLHGIQILAGAAVDGLLVAGSVFLLSGNEGINVSGGAQVDDLAVRDSAFLLNKIGIGITGAATRVEGFTVRDSGFVGQGQHGIYIHGATVSDLEIRDTQFAGSVYQGIHIQNATVDGAVIADSVFEFSRWGLLIRGSSNVTGLHVVGNVFSDHSETALGLSSGSISGALIDSNTFVNSGWEHIDVGLYWMGTLTASDIEILRNFFGPGTQWAAIYVDGDAVFGLGDVVAHYNAFSTGAWGVFNANAVTVDAALNWWGDPDGPMHASNPAGAGDLVSDSVIFSPWLGTSPDGDPLAPGVQITGPMLIIVAPVGPEPAGGYLNTAIAGANTLPFADTIRVREGTYDASTPITGPVSILSCTSCPNPTTLTGDMTFDAAGILIGRMGQGFTILGDITVGAGADASTIHINWNDLFGTVTNDGVGMLDATYNWWGGAHPSARTFGSVNYDPYLPKPVCEVLAFMEKHGLNPDEAIIALGSGAPNHLLFLMWLAGRLGVSVTDAEDLVEEYGSSAILSALDRTTDFDDFVRLLLGYGAAPAGGAGMFVDLGVAGGAGSFQGQTVDAVYEIGQSILVSFELLDFQGNPVLGIGAWVTLIQLHEDGHQTIWYWGATYYNPETGLQEISIPTAGLPAGYYNLGIGFRDGTQEQILIQIVVE